MERGARDFRLPARKLIVREPFRALLQSFSPANKWTISVESAIPPSPVTDRNLSPLMSLNIRCWATSSSYRSEEISWGEPEVRETSSRAGSIRRRSGAPPVSQSET